MSTSKASGLTGKVHHRRIPGMDLSEWEHRYVLAYCADPTRTNSQLLLEIGYPCDPKAYAARGSAIWRKPAVQEVIWERMQDVMKRLDLDTYTVLKRLKDIAFTNADEVMEFEGGVLKVKDFSKINSSAKAAISGIDQTPGEFGTTTRVRLRDPYPALEKLIRILGAENPARQSATEPHKLQKEAIRAVRSKGKSVIDACLDLEEAGVPIPQTLLVLLNQQAKDVTNDEGPMVIPTPEEQAAKAEARLHEIKVQRENFLPERREQIVQIKAELTKNSRGDAFAPGSVA